MKIGTRAFCATAALRLIARSHRGILLAMDDAFFDQLGFDFGAFADVSAPASESVASESVPSDSLRPQAIVPTTRPPLSLGAPLSDVTAGIVPTTRPPEAIVPTTRPPARGRAATRARTAVLFSRLQDLGLRGVDGLVLMRTRTVMVSLMGRTLRVNEGYTEAPEPVLRAIVVFAMARTKAARTAARDEILRFNVDRAPVPRRVEPARPGDLALIAQLTAAHRQFNRQHFGDGLRAVPIRLSGRMATRLAHYDAGSAHLAPEIVMSRKHVVKHGWREAMHTLLHEMVHQWQHETGAPVDHGPGFRAKAREVGITPSARRDVTPLAQRRRGVGT